MSVVSNEWTHFSTVTKLRRLGSGDTPELKKWERTLDVVRYKGPLVHDHNLKLVVMKEALV